jgi:PAS domain S-box-containing protein
VVQNQETTQIEVAPAAPTPAAPAHAPAIAPRVRRRGLLSHGEGAVARVGIVTAALVVGVLGLSSWWTLRTYHAQEQASRERELLSVSGVLSSSIESLMNNGDITGVRRLVADAAVFQGLSGCRVVIDGVGILADAEPSRITVARLPEADNATATPAEVLATGTLERGEGGLLRVRTSLAVAGQNNVALEVTCAGSGSAMGPWEVQAGIAGIAALGMGGLLMAYRQMRMRWSGLGAIRESLMIEAQRGGVAGELEVGEAMGPEATAWNGVVRERETLRRLLALEKAAEKIAQRSGAGGELSAACDAMWHGLLVLDDKAQITYANGAAAVLLNVKREELLEKPVRDVFENESIATASEALATGRTRQRAIVDVTRPGTERTVLRLTAKPMRREESGRAIVVVEDVTQQKVAEESRGAFVAQATHELRTPLTNIRLYIETLVDEGETDPAVRAKCLNVVQSEVRRLERIVGDMLSVAEIEAGQLKLRSAEVRMDQLFTELEADLRAGADDKEIKLVFDLPPKFGVMTADRDKLMLALHNIVGNAIKYTPAGGTVSVRVSEEGSGLRVDVVDNGIGIKPEEQELVFERFYRAKDRRLANITGSGIGLALARQIVRLHGGDITVASAIDKGSTFTITVPISNAPAMRAAA